MKLTIDTKEDSHDDLRKVIKMLQHIVGDSQEVFSNQPTILSGQAADSSPFTNIFGDASSPSSMPESAAAMNENTTSTESQPESSSVQPSSSEETSSTSDLFAELFNEEELKKMDLPKEDEEEEVKAKPKSKKYNIEFY